MESAGLERARAIAEKPRGKYKKLKANVEAHVVRWEWADFARHSYEPAYFEIQKFPRGKVLANKTDAPVPPFQIGYDAQDRMIVERTYTEFPGHIKETFYVHEADGIAEIHYDSYTPRKGLIGVMWYSMRDGKVIAIESASKSDRGLSTTYDYNKRGQMIRSTRHQYDTTSRTVIDWYDLEYDAKGRIASIHWCFPDGRRLLHYERATPKMTLRAHKKELLEGLTAAIIDGMRQAAITDEVYVLVVRYSEAAPDHMLPPCIDLNTVPERERLLKEHPDDLEYLWNPCEWLPHHCDMIYHLPPDLEVLCAAVNQDIWQNERFDDALRFTNELMTALYKADLPIRRFDDFVTVGLIVENGECDMQVKTQMPARVRKLLMKKGWLPEP